MSILKFTLKVNDIFYIVHMEQVVKMYNLRNKCYEELFQYE